MSTLVWTKLYTDSLSFEIAASLPTIYATVRYGLVDAAHLREGETILFHVAAGGVGQAAIQYSKCVGAEVFATVSFIEKKEVNILFYLLMKAVLHDSSTIF